MGAKTVLTEDFGYANTSSMVVVRCADGVSADRLAFAGSKPGKRETRTFLETHVSGAEVEVLERVQLTGRAFLGRVAEHADRIDALRSEIDRGYARLGRLKGELNRLSDADPTTPVPEAPEEVTGPEAARYRSMHGRFFRLLGVATLKLPSFYSSSTDCWTGTVDKGQRSGSRFRARARDGTEWEADLHAAELLARSLFLRPKPAAPAAASTM